MDHLAAAAGDRRSGRRRLAGRAREALEAARSRAADPGLGIRLLVDMRAIIANGPKGPDEPRMPTADVIAELLKIEQRVWQFYGKAQRTIRDTDIAALLEPYEVGPKQLKQRGKNLRGYHLCDVEAALTRYAPSFILHDKETARYPRYAATEDENAQGPTMV